MTWLQSAPPVIIVGGFALAVLVAMVGRASKALVPWLVLLAPLATLITGVGALLRISSLGEGQTLAPYVGRVVSSGSYTWFDVGGTPIRLGWAVDSLAAIMLVVVGVVASMVVIFSIGYMRDDRGWVRYFALLAAFTASMDLLVCADGFAGLFFGWELVGACSYLLIGFWFEKPSAAAAAIKAFLTTRVGDAGLLLGLAVLWKATESLGYREVFASLGALSASALTAAALLLFVGAAGKSAQFPLHIWLPDAMEGPTPVSALIHAATMVAAGVFLVARTWPLFEAADSARAVILAIGVITAFGAATIAVAQRDIKKVLAYSTVSQLGYMMAAMGAGAWVAGMFHLTTHAAFKALLFLAAGSVIHGSGTQDLRDMGGLARKMPLTAVTWIVGAAALAGIPPLAGFFSKDAVVSAVYLDSPFAGVTLSAASLLTAFYVARATRLAFFGDYRGNAHPHEGPWTMKLPLLALAVPAVVLGLAATPFAELLGHEAEEFSLPLLAVSVAIAIVGLVVGWLALRDGAASDERLESRLGSVWRGAAAGWGVDGLVMRYVVAPAVTLSRIVYAFIDRLFIDWVVEGVAVLSAWIGRAFARLQNGDAQWYATLIAVGMLIVLVMTIWAGRLGL